MNLRCLRYQFFVLYLLSFFGFFAGHAQDLPYKDVSISSPTAASLGKYADIPVNYNTGIPQVSVPIYTIKSGPLEMPISVSYHASGLKVAEAASWVGAGWSLNAGGVITRTVMGQPDERATNSGSISDKGHFSDYGYNKYLIGTGAVEDWIGFAQGRKDGEPDLFFFNFGGYTGKFYFRDDRTPVLVPQQDIKIIPYYPSDDENYIVLAPGGGSIQGFTVITPDGTKYFFGNTPGFTGTVLPYEVTNPYSTGSGYASASAISSWFLNKISTADDQFSINFSYTPENYGYFVITSTPIDSYSSGGFGPGQQEYNIIKNITRGVRLDSITFPGGFVNFVGQSTNRIDLSDDAPSYVDNLNQNAKALEKIIISGTSGFSKKFSFFYDYFDDNVTTLPSAITAVGYNLFTDKKRLKLLSIQEASADGAIINPPYQFNYFSEFVPRRISFGQDHWGFYNGVTGNTSLLPTYMTNDGSVIATFSGANRQSSWPAMRGGALKEIIYPTGGSSLFDFEAADQFSTTTTSLENVDILNFSIHLFGQTGSLSNDLAFSSNGNPIAFFGDNTSLYSAHFSLKNSSGTEVYTANFAEIAPPQTHAYGTFTVNLPAGNYHLYGTFPQGNIGMSGGIQVKMSQIGNVSHVNQFTVGGLRIKTITHKESPSTSSLVTQYEYPNGGIIYSVPSYVQHIRNDLVQELGYYEIGVGFRHDMINVNGCPAANGFYLKSGGSIRPMQSFQGNHIGYPFVKVSQAGNGYSEYHYYTSNSGYVSTTVDLSTPSLILPFHQLVRRRNPIIPALLYPLITKKENCITKNMLVNLAVS